MFAALAFNDRSVQHNALTGLYEIARRPDGAVILRNHIGAIGEPLLSSPDSETQSGVVLILGTLAPTPPEVTSVLLKFLKETDRDSKAQAGAIFELLHVAPENPQVITGVEEFLSRSLDSQTRISVLNAPGNPSRKNIRFVRLGRLVVNRSEERHGKITFRLLVLCRNSVPECQSGK